MVLAVPFPGPAYAAFRSISLPFRIPAKPYSFLGTRFDKSHFDIFTVNADGSDMVRLTSAKKQNGKMADNEDPSYSPDGRHVLYISNRTGANQLYISTIDGEVERRITFDNSSYFKPHWSPAFD